MKKTIKKIKKIHKKVTNKLLEIQKEKELSTPVKENSVPKKKKENIESIYLDIKAITVVKVMITILAVLAVAQIFNKISSTLLLIFIAGVFAAAISPIIDWAEKKKIPRFVSILGLYIVFIGFLGSMISTLIPLIIKQVIEMAGFLQEFINTVRIEGMGSMPFGDKIEPFIQEFADYVDKEQLINNLQQGAQSAASNVTSFAGNTVSAVFAIFGGIAQMFMVLFFTFFMVLDTNGLEKFILSLFPHKYEYSIIDHGKKIQEKLGAWFRGQLTMCFLVGGVVYAVLSLMGVEYASTFALIAALTELVPVIGPLIAAIICVPLILTQSTVLGGMAAIFFLVLNWIESNIMVPIIMKKATDLNPMVTIVAMLVGSELLGIIGIVLSIPIASAINLLVQEYAHKKK